MNEPMMNRIRGHSRDRLCRAVVSVTITVRRAPKSSAGPLSAQNRILRIFNTTFVVVDLLSKTQFRENA